MLLDNGYAFRNAVLNSNQSAHIFAFFFALERLRHTQRKECFETMGGARDTKHNF